MKATRTLLLLLTVWLCLSTPGPAQSHAHRSFSQQHKDAEKYQKHLMKERRKLEKKQNKAAKDNRNRHR
jgi:hypothetical protein